MGLFSGGPCPLLTLIGIKDALVMVINTNCLRNSVIGGGVAAVSSLVGGGGRCVSRRVFISLETSFCGRQHHCVHGRRHRLPSGTKAQSVKPSGGSPDSDGA